MPLILKNVTYIEWKTLGFTEVNIIIEEGANGKIRFIGNIPENTTVIDCKGKFVTRSFACGHHHAYSALARGMGAPLKTPENFREILQYVWWTLDKALDRDMIEAGALATAIACAKNGITFAVDHHASPDAIEGSLDIIAKAFEKVGVSHLLCYEITDRDGTEKAEKGLAETERYISRNQGLVGLHASFTVGDRTLAKAVELAAKYNSGIHIHVAEDRYDQEHCKKTYGQSVVDRLQDAGVLDFPKTILVHCLHLDKHEKNIIKNSKAWIVQNTDSNLNNSVGRFDSRGLGDRIMLGTDGMYSDMLRSAKSAFFTGQGFDDITYAEAYRRLRNAHIYLESNGFSGDGENNLVVFDYDSPTEMNAGNFLGHFLFGLESRHVQHVISSGKLIVRDREILTVDERDILNFCRKQGKLLWRKMSS